MAAFKSQPSLQAARGRIKYLRSDYEPSTEPIVPPESKYWTGETYNGMKIYAPRWGTPVHDKMPRHLYVKRDGTDCQCYARVSDPPVYAYTVCGAFNTGEAVVFGLFNDHGGFKELRNMAPWVIERKAGGRWVPAFTPVSPQVIMPIPDNEFKEWSWDQEMDDGSLAPFGEYRIKFGSLVGDVASDYAFFRIGAEAPAVDDRPGKNYNDSSADREFLAAPQVVSFNQAYSGQGYSVVLRDELISQMKFKAMAKGLDPVKLKSAIQATGVYARGNKGLPCLAVHTNYNNSPVWVIVYAIEVGGILSVPHYYIVDDATGEVVRENTYKSPHP